MTYGHYRHTNKQPGEGFGEVIDIDLDALPTTDQPGNWPVPNLHLADDGTLSKIPGRQIYLHPDTHEGYRSTADEPTSSTRTPQHHPDQEGPTE